MKQNGKKFARKSAYPIKTAPSVTQNITLNMHLVRDGPPHFLGGGTIFLSNFFPQNLARHFLLCFLSHCTIIAVIVPVLAYPPQK